MENETEAVSDVFVLTFSPSPCAYQPLFFTLAVIFETLLPFFQCLSHSLPPSHTLTYKNRVITGLQGAITSVIQGFYVVAWP